MFNDEAFTAAIRTVAAGGTVLDPEVVGKLMTRRSRAELVARLTPREREVLALMAEGRSDAEWSRRCIRHVPYGQGCVWSLRVVGSNGAKERGKGQ